MDQYHISDLPSRYLMTQHFQSSIQQPNLQNVEAKLSVARQKNHDLALSYFRNKYGSTSAYEDFVKNHNMGEMPVTRQPDNEEMLRAHLDRKAREIQKQFYYQENYGTDLQKSEHQEPQWTRKYAKKQAKNNPWVNKSAEKDEQNKKQQINQSKYVDSVVAPKNKNSEFVDQFKNYLKAKQEAKQKQDGYDSDPQIYQSKVINKKSPEKRDRSNQKLNHSTSFVDKPKKQKPVDPQSDRKQFIVTIPVPFSFDQRDKDKKSLKVIEQKKEQNQHFRANPIPKKVLQTGLYEKMLQEDQKRIQQRKKNSMIVTLANQKPFSFIDRKTKKKTKEEREQFVFKAKPIPWYCSVDLLEKKKEAEIIRNQKIAKEAQQNLAKAKLPPRMERDFQQKQVNLTLTEQQKVRKPQSKSKIYREPPDFDRLHREFEQGLQRKRKQNKVTKPEQFNFAQRSYSRPKTAHPGSAATQFYNTGFAKTKNEYFRKMFQPTIVAGSTKKFDQQVQKRRQQMEKKRKEQQTRRLQQEKRNKINEQLKNKLLAATQFEEAKKRVQKQNNQNQMKQQQKIFKEWKQKCIEKGRQQPMLIQRPLKRDLKIQKLKKLHQISSTLKQNGIKGKDHDSYFNKQQLLLLQDWQILKNKI